MKGQRSILSRNDLSILTAKTAEEMLGIHEKDGVDLILVELDIDEMGGDGLCTSIRNNSSLRQVSLILVHQDTPEAQQRAIQCGANALVPQPINADLISNRIQGLLDIKVRESMRVLIKISVDGKFEDDFFFSHSQNISSSGILLATDILLAVGNRISCSFFLQGKEVTVQGVIMRVIIVNKNLYQYGVKFVDIDRSLQTLIEEFVQSRRDNGKV